MIYRYDFRYSLAKIPVKTALRANFNKLVITGRSTIPKNKPVIFAPNHRNALIDALLLVYISWHTKQIVFLARADIFKKKFVSWILRGMRIVPVYRIRDGKDNLDKNTEIFDISGRILKNNNPIALFPEARHNPKQSLLPLQKAAPRIVLPTEAKFDFSLDSRIIPVSIYYTDEFEFLSDCYLSFGNPIYVDDYKEVYEQNPNLAINKLRNDLEERMKNLIVNIWNDEFYDEYKQFIAWNDKITAKEKFQGKKDAVLQATLFIVKHLDDLFENNRAEFDRKIENLREANRIVKPHKITTKDNLLEPSSTSSILTQFFLLILSAPVALFGFINNIFPMLIYRKLRALFKDKQFIPSVRYASGLIFVPIFDLLQSIFVQIIFNDWLITLAYFLLMPVSFLFAIYWRKWLKSAKSKWKVNRFRKNYLKDWEKVVSLIKI